MNPELPKSTAIEVDEANFEREVLGANQPVLVAFWSPWSQPCQVLKPVLTEVAAACVGTTKVVQINADNNPTLSLWYDIQAIPTVLFFVHGTLRDKVVGTASAQAILAKLQQVLQAGRARDARAKQN